MNDVMKEEGSINDPKDIKCSIQSLLYSALDFQSFFITVCKLKISFSLPELRILYRELEDFKPLYGNTAIAYLRDCVQVEMTLPCKNPIKRRYTEKELQNTLVEHFSTTFPSYAFISTEVPVKGVGRIDILARDLSSNRYVIIELKVKSKNPTSQLLAYASNYENPVLIGITEETLTTDQKSTSVQYYTFRELGVI